MKAAFTLLIGLAFISLGALAGPRNSSEYFICNFNHTITQFELNELKNQGFKVFETKNDKHVVYVKAEHDAMFSKKLKAKMKELIQVDKNGNRIYLVETVSEDSPEFLKVFFNFI